MREIGFLPLTSYRAHGGHHIRAHTTTAQQLAERAQKEAPPKSFDDLVPSHYHEFRDVFSKESFDELPERRPWGSRY